MHGLDAACACGRSPPRVRSPVMNCAVALVHVARDEHRADCASVRAQQGRDAAHVGREARGVQRADVLAGRHQHLAAQVAALLLRRELVLEVHASRARLDHRLHQLVGVQRAAEPGFRVGHDRRHPVRCHPVTPSLGVLDLVGAAQRGVDPAHDVRHRIDRIQRLVGVHLPRGIGVGGDLPAGQVDRLQPGPHLLHRLVAGQRAERVNVGLGLQQRATAAPRRAGPAYARPARSRAAG